MIQFANKVNKQLEIGVLLTMQHVSTFDLFFIKLREFIDKESVGSCTNFVKYSWELPAFS